jgi:hypothetical protein
VRLRAIVVSGFLGAILGASTAYVGATQIFTCREPAFEAVCAGGPPILAVMWGIMIGAIVGVVIGLALSKRLTAR